MPSPKQEAELIVDALFEDWGTGGDTRGECPFVDGRDAILEMKKAKFPGWQEVEWAGYHIKYLVQKASELYLRGKIKSYDRNKRHFVKGNYLWDARFNANEYNIVILGDVEEYNNIIKNNSGIGVLVIDAAVNYDFNEDFRRWHEEQKGGSSDYSIEREIEGRPVRVRKTEYMIRKAFAYFFTPDDLKNGVKDGWVDDTFQKGMRNADGSPRNAKYRFKINDVPEKNLLFVKNFNEDPEEFKEDFSEYN